MAKNKKAYFDYEIIDKYIAGIELKGSEVKSILNRDISISEAYVKIIDNEAYLWNSTVNKYKHANADTVEDRVRKLLLKKSEIKKLDNEVRAKGLALIPLTIIYNKNIVKLEFGLCRGKKKYEKRDKVLNKELKKEFIV